MIIEKPQIDPYLFECQFNAFCKYVEEQSNVSFKTFASHPYTELHESYKYDIYKLAREALAFQAWNESDIGSGEIISSTIDSFKVPDNNLVPWQDIAGDESRLRKPLLEALKDQEKLKSVESCLFNLYHNSNDANSFQELVSIFGKTYPLISYLFFIKDRSKYLPIRPTYIDRAFELLLLETDFKTSYRCSWENYYTYISLIGELKKMLSETLSAEVTLLDSHSFAWILSSEMDSENKVADIGDYLNLSTTERETIIKARIGQGQFRENLINYWSACAVSGCKEPKLLRASHIKPWSKSNLSERLSLYNGLLLAPTLDLCFDLGFISFDDTGKIIISNQLNEDDMKVLGIHPNMKLSKIESDHIKYLEYHRRNILNES